MELVARALHWIVLVYQYKSTMPVKLINMQSLCHKKNYPDIMHIGDVKGIIGTLHKNLLDEDIDLLIGGSPCQDLSIAKSNRKGLQGERSGLFWEYVRILNEVKPKYFILENVASMPKGAMHEITAALYGVEPIMINAALVSAQNRKRLFWVGKLQPDGTYQKVNIQQPDDRGIVLRDILLDGDTDDLKALCVTATYASKNRQDYEKKRMGQMIRVGDIGSNSQAHRVYSPDGKSVALSALGGGQGAKTGLYLVQGAALRNRGEGKKPEFNGTEKANSMTTVQTDSMLYITQRPRGYNKGGIFTEKCPTLTKNSFEQNNHVVDGDMLRKLHPVECERLQGLPDGYTEWGYYETKNREEVGHTKVSNTQRYKMLGNAFNVDVVAHIIKNLTNN